MILIVTSGFDLSSDFVIDWLLYQGKSFIRINEDVSVELRDCKFESGELSCRVEIIEAGRSKGHFALRDIHSYWYRRGHLNVKSISFPTDENCADQGVLTSMRKYVNREQEYAYKVLLEQLESRNGIGSYYDNATNKLANLLIACASGLHTPATIVTTSKAELIQFFNSHKRIITKGIVHNGWEKSDSIEAWSLTNEVTWEIVNEIDHVFALSCFQEYIDKYCELRVFYLKGQMKCAAIFSQTNDKTRLDFRNYDHNKMNRMVPFRLPEDVQAAIRTFMSTVKMNCGSLDLILSRDLRYYFLEVNPVGQFGFVSKSCNFGLEKMIADELT